MLMKELAPSEVILVGVDVRRRDLLDGFFLVFGQHDAERGDDARCDLILYREYVFELPIIPRGPELRAVRSAHELRIEAQPLARLSNTALENRRDLELAADLANVVALALEGKRRGP